MAAGRDEKKLMPSILLTNYYRVRPLEIIRGELPDGFNLIPLVRPAKEEIVARAGGADYFLVGGRLPIDREVLDAAAGLRMIQRTGVGLDSFDLEALRQRGIPVYVNRGVNAASVAEHALMLMLAVLRRLAFADAGVKAGQWLKHDLGIECRDLRGKVVGLVGLGAIGSRVAGLLRAFEARVLYYDVVRRHEAEESQAAVYRELKDLLAVADIISLHCPLNEKTERLIGPAEIAGMKPGAILVNTARGRLVDEPALCAALASGQLAGAGLDVFAREPTAPDNPLFKLDNVVLTPHVASLTAESFRLMMREAFRNIALFEQGRLDLIAEKKLAF